MAKKTGVVDTKQIITNVNKKFTSTEFLNRKTIIDDDMQRYFIKPYQVLGSEGANKNRPLPGMTFVTGNKPQIWANHCMSLLTSNDPVVTFVKRDANIQDKDIEMLRNWWNTIFYLANEEAEGKAKLPINSHMAWNVVLTDCIVPRAIIDNSGDKVRYDIQIAETTSVCWAKGKNGFNWVAFRFLRSKEEILDEYPAFKINGEETEETHWWGKIDNKVAEIVFIDKEAVADENGEVARDWSGSMDTIPCIVSPVLLNPNIRIKGTLQTSGASVFWGIRDQFDELNRAKSIKATLLMREACPALKHQSLDSTGAAGSQLAGYPANGAIVEMGNAKEDVSPIFSNTPTALSTAQVYDEDVTSQVEQGSAPEIAYGGQEYGGMPTSLWDRRSYQMGKVLTPRRKAMEIAYKGIFNSMFDQFIKMGLSLQVESNEGLIDQTVTAEELAKLKGKFRVSFSVTSVEPTGDILKFQKKLAADQAGVDPDWSDENILNYENMTEIRENKVKRISLALDPTLNLFEDFAIACKEYEAMDKGREKQMKLQEIKYRKANLENIAKMAVNGGQNDNQPK